MDPLRQVGTRTAMKVVDAAEVLEAAEMLRDFEPDIMRGPGRKLGL